MHEFYPGECQLYKEGGCHTSWFTTYLNSHPTSILIQAFHFQCDDWKTLPFRSTSSLLPIKNCFSMPNLMYLLRSLPTFQHPDLLADIYVCLKSCATDIRKVSFDNIGWIQETLTIRQGGIGMCRATDLALSA